MAASEPYLSIVVPVFNEEDNVDALVSQLTTALDGAGYVYELLLIDDGSTDRSYERLAAHAARVPGLRVIRFRRNFGQTPAFCAGFDAARGTWVVTLDADLQNDPADIPMLVRRAEEGFDIVSGWRKNRQDAMVMRKLPSKVANWLIGRVTGVRLHDYGCSLKVYHRDVVKNIRLYGELHRFVPAVAHSVGARITEVAVNHRARTAGESKYTGLWKTIRRATKVLLDMLTVRFLHTYGTRPIHVFGSLGLLLLASGFGTGAYLAYLKFGLGLPIGDRPLLTLAALLVTVGVHFLTLGFLGEMLARTYHESQGKPIYFVRERAESLALGGQPEESPRSLTT